MNFRLCRAFKPFSRINRAAFLRLTRLPYSRRSASRTRGPPYRRWRSAKIRRINFTGSASASRRLSDTPYFAHRYQAPLLTPKSHVHLPDGVFFPVLIHKPARRQRGPSCAKMARTEVRPLFLGFPVKRSFTPPPAAPCFPSAGGIVPHPEAVRVRLKAAGLCLPNPVPAASTCAACSR
jgi:hypothetical protein